MMDELTRARLRHALLELENLAPEMAAAFLTNAEHGPLLREALGERRRWACPLCATVVYGVEAPTGWHVVEPFARVAACATCKPVTRRPTFAPAPMCLCGHSRTAHAHYYPSGAWGCQRYGCGCRSFRLPQ